MNKKHTAKKKGSENKDGHSAGRFRVGSGAKPKEQPELPAALNPHEDHEEARRKLRKLQADKRLRKADANK